MRIFMCELKKLWNWRILAGIAALAILVWFALMYDFIDGYDSLTTHGIYGAYQAEMFDLYGETLEADELAEFDLPGKKRKAILEMNSIIAQEPIFSENNIQNYEDFIALRQLASSDIPYEEAEKLWKKVGQMEEKLENWYEDITLDEWYLSPYMRLSNLETLESRYVEYQDNLDNYTQYNSYPVVSRSTQQVAIMRNANLIHYELCPAFSQYAAIAAVFSVFAVLILIAPLLTTDRWQKINLLQYSSHKGRSILRCQFAATVVSSFILSTVLIFSGYFLFLTDGAIKYWHAHIMAIEQRQMWLYNITFGQFVWILAGLSVVGSVAAACFTFILARFSANLVNLMIKAVPVGTGVAAIVALTVNMALSDKNILFRQVFHGSIDGPEIITAVALAVTALAAAGAVLYREKKIDVN
ncbi:hypothetical protein Ami103574_04120 [Aminipila butyrica]|uniref:Abc-2 family transporter protein n=1 Tax=Aminipila butyrica TaxID=433296 RepID=A0A858BWU7_9FIRM|nr:hypothetical protein [Aminipila butyrica]QIB68556.1 hypothetical protein Ami103574_04120 [Aminipila butyrica]